MVRFILFLLLPVTGFSQAFIGKNKAEVKNELQNQKKGSDSLSISISDKDSALILTQKKGGNSATDFVYGFDKSGICQSEKVISYGCDSCFYKLLKKVLDQTKYEWKKLNENQYVSKYAAKMMLEVQGENIPLSYSILRTQWNEEFYKMITEK
jgi:hypothetical protein